MLEANEDVRAAVRARHAEVLVDEFQDTSPVQARLLECVSRPGALFVVGDPKQSIYGFRGADVDVFLERVMLRAGAGAEVLDPEDLRDLGPAAASRLLERYS